jgi:hypothetical protein
MNVIPSGLQPQPNPTVMSDVIDSLKRLERVGSETSKTTEKLIAAAKELEALIVKLVTSITDAPTVTIAYKGNDPGNPTPNPIAYVVQQGKLFRYVKGRGNSVSANRETALGFSADIATDLLERFREQFEGEAAKNKKATENLLSAIDSLKQQ